MEQTARNFALEANELINSGDYEQAIKLCVEGLTLYPNYPSAYCVLAKAYYLSNQATLATNIVEKAIKIFPYNVTINETKHTIENLSSLSPTTILENTNTEQNNNIVEDNTFTVKSEYEQMFPSNTNFADSATSNYLEINDLEELNNDMDINSIHTEECPEEQKDENNLEQAEVPESHKENVKLEPTNEEFGHSVPILPEDMQETNHITTCKIDELETNENLDLPLDDDEALLLLDNDVYFLEHTQQESIASVLEASDTSSYETIDTEQNSTIQNTTTALEITDLEEVDNYSDNSETEYIKQIRTSVKMLYEIDLGLSSKAELSFKSIEKNDCMQAEWLCYSQNNKHIETNLASSRPKFLSSELKFPMHMALQSFEKSFPYALQQEELNTELGDNTFTLKSLQKASLTDNTASTHLPPITDIVESLKDSTKIVEPFSGNDDASEQEMPLIASETMAKILIKQNKLALAMQVYELLIVEKPDKAEYYRKQIQSLQNS